MGTTDSRQLIGSTYKSNFSSPQTVVGKSRNFSDSTCFKVSVICSLHLERIFGSIPFSLLGSTKESYVSIAKHPAMATNGTRELVLVLQKDDC